MTFEEIENAFVDAVNEITGVQAMTYEPERLPATPCVTMLLTKTAQEDFATGNVTEGQWEWRVTLHVTLRDYKTAQEEVKALIPSLLRVTRINPTLNQSVDWARLTDSGFPPVFDSASKLLSKPLTLEAVSTLAD